MWIREDRVTVGSRRIFTRRYGDWIPACAGKARGTAPRGEGKGPCRGGLTSGDIQDQLCLDNTAIGAIAAGMLRAIVVAADAVG